MSTNDAVADAFEAFADLLEAKDVDYKPRAYRRAAENVRDHPRPIEELAAEGPDEVTRIDGVGEALAEKVVEYVRTGSIEELAELRADLPVEMDALTGVEGVGPKTVGTLYETLGVQTLDDLERAASEGRIREVDGFGERSEAKIREGIPLARQAQERELLAAARPLAEAAMDHLAAAAAVERVETAGSIRRWRATVGDVDVLAAGDDPAAVVAAFVDWPAATDVIEAGANKASVRADGVRVDLRAVDSAEFGAALQYFTGSKDHNVALRNRAIARDLKLNEYGVFDVSGVEDDGRRAGERVAGETEAEVYAALDLPVVPPELREATGEIEAAREEALPDLVAVGEMRGDLHTHTDWSDGKASIREMATAAEERGHDYHAVTDHATGPGMVGGVGLDADDLREQIAAVEDAAADVGIDLLTGVEANLHAGGGLSVDDDVLAELDVVVAAPHSALDQGREAATDRLCRAVEHPAVDVLGHPTGRLLSRRRGLDPDVERVAAAAADAGTALEVNASRHRLDLGGSAVRAAVAAGATVSVNTDAHHPAALDRARYGVHTARRGWAEAAGVLNARDTDEIRAFVD